MSWLDDVPDGASLLIDTNPIVYLFENHPLSTYFKPLFLDIESGRINAVITPITLAEIVAGPLRFGKEALAERYRTALTRGRGWHMTPINESVAFISAKFRVRYGLRLPDALQLGAAVHNDCFGLVSHDRDFSQVDEVPVFGLEKK